MSLSRSPSPVPEGGWSSPGLNMNTSGRSSPVRAIPGPNGGQMAWETAKLRTSAGGSGFPTFQTQNKGFFTRHMRRLSSKLPKFNMNANAPYAEKEKLGRGRWISDLPLAARVKSIFGRMGRKMKLRLFICLMIVSVIFVFYNTREWGPVLPSIPPGTETDS